MSWFRLRAVWAGLVVVALVGIAGCGGSSKSGQHDSTTTPRSARSTSPARHGSSSTTAPTSGQAASSTSIAASTAPAPSITPTTNFNGSVIVQGPAGPGGGNGPMCTSLKRAGGSIKSFNASSSVSQARSAVASALSSMKRAKSQAPDAIVASLDRLITDLQQLDAAAQQASSPTAVKASGPAQQLRADANAANPTVQSMCSYDFAADVNG